MSRFILNSYFLHLEGLYFYPPFYLILSSKPMSQFPLPRSFNNTAARNTVQELPQTIMHLLRRHLGMNRINLFRCPKAISSFEFIIAEEYSNTLLNPDRHNIQSA